MIRKTANKINTQHSDLRTNLKHNSIGPRIQSRAAKLVTIVGVIFSIGAATLEGQWEFTKDRDRFQKQSDILVDQLQRQIDSYAQLTRSVGAFSNTVNDVAPLTSVDSSSPISSLSLEQFQTFTQSLLPHYNGLLGLGWAQSISRQQRETYEQQMRQQGYANFQIKERNVRGQIVPADDRPFYFPTTYVEPASQNHPSLGIDAILEPPRRIALEKAELLGVTVSTSVVTLDNGQPGFILYTPVFSASSQNTDFLGAVFGMYELHTWMATAIANLDLNHIDFYLYSLPEDQLDSALMKTTVNANDSFLIGYDRATQSLHTSPQDHSQW
jgi:CHASE1-domain containing sensor protein